MARNRKRRPTAERPWRELVPATVRPTPEAVEFAQRHGLDDHLGDPEVWMNDRYIVTVQRRDDETVVHLAVRRPAGAPQRPVPWEHLQRIKGELAGRDAEAVELYPNDDRVADTNQTHLWCLRPSEQWPIGYPKAEA